MKKNLLLILLIISIVLYIVGIYFYSITDSFIILLATSILIAVSVNLYKSYTKKEKEEIKFKVDKVEIKQTNKKFLRLVPGNNVLSISNVKPGTLKIKYREAKVFT